VATLSELFPTAEEMAALSEYVAPFVAYGIGLCVVFWIIGYVIWFIIEFIR
jgi:hypothetical protein